MIKLCNSRHSKLEKLIENSEYVIGIRGKGVGILRRGNKEYNVKDIKRVQFSRGEEKQAIKLFVDANKIVLMSNAKFRYKSWFYPQTLHKYFIKYLLENKLDDDIPLMSDYGIKKSRRHCRGDNSFYQYMKERCPDLLKHPESLLHDSDFVNKYYHNQNKEKLKRK